MKKLLIVLVTACVVLGALLLLAGNADEPLSEAETPAAVPSALPELADNAAVSGAGAQQDKKGFVFSTVDREGNAVDESIFDGYELVMMNFWEPWCPPCVGEMPDLQKLWENYGDKGFLLIGVYSTEEDADDVIASTGVSYPILKYAPEFEALQSGFVPNTVFFGSDGELLTEEPIVGSMSYDDWANVVESYLG